MGRGYSGDGRGAHSGADQVGKQVSNNRDQGLAGSLSG